MKKLKLFILILLGVFFVRVSMGQTLKLRTNTTFTQLDQRLAVGSNLYVPYGSSASLGTGLDRQGGIYYNTSNGFLYTYGKSSIWEFLLNKRKADSLYVPYSGASSNVNLGSRQIFADFYRFTNQGAGFAGHTLGNTNVYSGSNGITILDSTGTFPLLDIKNTGISRFYYALGLNVANPTSYANSLASANSIGILSGNPMHWYSGDNGNYTSIKNVAGALTFLYNDVSKGDIDALGNLVIVGANATKASGTAWANPSDARLKKNVVNYSKGIAELKLIRPVTYNFNKASGLDSTGVHLSVIAQEIESVLPGTVSTYKGKLNGVDTTLKKFDASEITFLLVNSLKQAIARIEALEARLN